MQNKVLDIVRRRLGIGVNHPIEELITEYIEQIEVKIKRYCNIREVTGDLKFVWASMVIELLKAWHPNEEVVKSLSDATPSSVSIGKFSITNDKKSNQSTKLSVDDLITGYKSELNSFKRLKAI
jgi:hypothetical protein